MQFIFLVAPLIVSLARINKGNHWICSEKIDRNGLLFNKSNYNLELTKVV
jgi:hypothetical protein